MFTRYPPESVIHRAAWIVPILAVVTMLSTARAQITPGASLQTITSGGVERSYRLYVPDGYSGEAMPLVLNFHGSGGAPANQVATSGFDSLADREDFAVAYPAGVFANTVSQRSWNANVDPGVDDVQFVRDVIDDVAAKVTIDTARIYATGMSGGGRMTSRLACAMADRLAAAAPVAGLQYPDGCVPVRAVPIVAFHGKADRVNPYELSAEARPYWRMGVETAVTKWREADGCAGDADISTVASDVELRVWSECDNGAEIRFYVDANDDHVWPEGASERIWAFFEHHAL
jgi:polyhydroxybutyrate depolymerase